MSYVKKPLVWSLYVDNEKDENSVFEIFQNNGKLYYQVNSSSPFYKSVYGKELTSENVGTAIKKFNERVKM